MIRALQLVGLALALTGLHGCASSREGWGRGRSVVLLEEPFLQLRRAPQAVDPKTGDVVLAWVGARTPETEPRIVRCELTLFVDVNGNAAPDPDEILAHRASRENAVKIMFDDIRVLAADARREVQARMDVRTERKGRRVTWRFAPD